MAINKAYIGIRGKRNWYNWRMSMNQHNQSAPREAGAVFLINRPKANIIEATTKPPVFTAKHEREVCYLNMSSMKISKKQMEKVPDRISVGGHQFDVNAIDDANPWPQGMEALRMSDADAEKWYAMKARHEAERQARLDEAAAFRKEALKRARRVCKLDCV